MCWYSRFFFRKIPLFSVVLVLSHSVSTHASDMVFEFNNPSFGGNPFNSSHLQGVASAQNKYKDPDADDNNDPADQFVRTLQSRLLSAIATQVTDAIFGENAQDSGLLRFGEQEISFVRGSENVTLTIMNTLDGSVTEVIIPVLLTEE